MTTLPFNAALNNRTVTVTIPREIAFDLKKIQRIQETLVGRLGHPGCYSGFDILFRQEVEFIADAKTLELRSAGV
jgi:hypothetical protein